MKALFQAFRTGFVEGARETPRGFFAPALAIFRWIFSATEKELHRRDQRPRAQA